MKVVNVSTRIRFDGGFIAIRTTAYIFTTPLVSAVGMALVCFAHVFVASKQAGRVRVQMIGNSSSAASHMYKHWWRHWPSFLGGVPRRSRQSYTCHSTTPPICHSTMRFRLIHQPCLPRAWHSQYCRESEADDERTNRGSGPEHFRLAAKSPMCSCRITSQTFNAPETNFQVSREHQPSFFSATQIIAKWYRINQCKGMSCLRTPKTPALVVKWAHSIEQNSAVFIVHHVYLTIVGPSFRLLVGCVYIILSFTLPLAV